MALFLFFGGIALFFFLMSDSGSSDYYSPRRHRSPVVFMGHDGYQDDRFEQWHYMRQQRARSRATVFFLLVIIGLLLWSNGDRQPDNDPEPVARQERPAQGRY